MANDQGNDEASRQGEVLYIPWQGSLYSKGYRSGLKLLILGDSFHSDTWSTTGPSDVVEMYIKDGSFKFYAGVQRMVTGAKAPDQEERRTFWDRVAFTNLVQEPMVSPSTEPTEEQWHRAWSCFPEVIRAVRPDLIFCFSRRGWNALEKLDVPITGSNLKQIRPACKPDDYAFLFGFSSIEAGYRVLAGCFNHPSRNNQLDDWHQWAVRLLEEAPSVLGTNTAK